jgi:hypothetical protein
MLRLSVSEKCFIAGDTKKPRLDIGLDEFPAEVEPAEVAAIVTHRDRSLSHAAPLCPGSDVSRNVEIASRPGLEPVRREAAAG